jgi:hypothetical protein
MTVSLTQDGEGLGTLRVQEKARRNLDDAGFIQNPSRSIFVNGYYIFGK